MIMTTIMHNILFIALYYVIIYIYSFYNNILYMYYTYIRIYTCCNINIITLNAYYLLYNNYV